MSVSHLQDAARNRGMQCQLVYKAVLCVWTEETCSPHCLDNIVRHLASFTSQHSLLTFTEDQLKSHIFKIKQARVTFDPVNKKITCIEPVPPMDSDSD